MLIAANVLILKQSGLEKLQIVLSINYPITASLLKFPLLLCNLFTIML